MRPLLSTILIICLALVSSATPARADESAVVEARAIFQTAKAHYDKGRFAKALAGLEQAYEIKKLSIFLRYMGDCQMELARYEEALSFYSRYLRKVPDAPGKEKIEENMALARGKLRNLRRAEYAGKKVPSALLPTGKDLENPVIHKAKPQIKRPPRGGAVPAGAVEVPGEQADQVSTVGVSKWVTGGLGLVGLALGVTFNRMAASRSDELLKAVKVACPADGPDSCSGNPGLDWPVARYSKEHLQMELEVEQFNELAVASFVVGGAAAAASVALFILDWLGKRERDSGGKQVTVVPLLDGHTAGLRGEVRF